jgi:hypothetical protein
MIACPNKSTKEWKALSSELGEDKSLLAYLRNGAVIPEIGRARELITNRGVLESLNKIPVISESSIVDTLKSSNLIVGDAVNIDGKDYYAINPNLENVGYSLSRITEKYGSVLQYRPDYVAVNDEGVQFWNNLANVQALDNQSLTDLSKNFLEKIGVGISEQDDVISMYGSNGIADFAERMVRIQSGMMDKALPEEALHFFLDMMDQENPALMDALNNIVKTNTYKETLAQYKNNPNYRTKDGQIRFDKIKKEALAKELAEQMKGNKPKAKWYQRILDAIINWVKGIKIQKSSNDILSEMFYAQNIALLNTNLKSSEMYNQLSDKEKTFYEAQNMNEEQRATLNNIISYVAPTVFNDDEHSYEYAGATATEAIKSVTKILGSDFYSDMDNEEIKAEILLTFETVYSDIIDPFDEDEVKTKKITENIIDKLVRGELTEEQLTEVFGGASMDPLSRKINEALIKASQAKTKTLFGTAIHSIVENIVLGKDFDLDEIMASDKIENIALRRLIDRKTLDRIVNGNINQKGIKDIIKEIKADGSVIMTEVSISNGKLGGTLDIIAIRPNGVVDIYDFKTKFAYNFGDNNNVKEDLINEFNSIIKQPSQDGVKDEPDTLEKLKGFKRSNLQKYIQQLSIYKKMLMEAGVRVGTLNVIGVPYRLDKETKKVTEIKPTLLSNIPYDSRIANFYFSDLDENLNASAKKPIVLERDERVKTLDQLEKNKLKEALVKALARLTEISNRYNSRGNLEELYKLLQNENSKTNKLDIQKSNVITTLNNFDEIKDFANVQLNFLEMIDSSVPIIKIVMDYFDMLKKETPTTREGASQRLNELMKAKDFLMGYKNMFDDILKYMGDIDHENPLVSKITALNGVIEKVQNNYKETITPVINEMMRGLFDEDSLNTIKREFNELIAAAKLRGDKERVKTLEEERDSLPSEKVIAELLKGDRGDANWLFSRLTATISNPDILLAGVAKKLKATLDRVRLQNKEWKDSLSTQFEKRADVYGRGLDIKKINDSLVYLVEEIDPVSGESMQVLHFKSEFNEKLYTEHAKLLHEVFKARKNNDIDALKLAEKAKREFEQKYMQTGYTTAYYELTKPLDTKVMYQGRQTTVRDVDADIRDQIKQLEIQYSNDDKLNGKFNPEYIKELQALNKIKSNLREKLDEKGNPKTGDALKIAEILEKYDENFRNLYEFEEQTEYFNRSREKAKIQYGEDSEEFKKWMSENTKMAIKDEFYKKRQALYEEKASILGTIESKEISDLNKELSTITKPYRDKDGVVRGNFIPEDVSIKIKEIQEKIDTLRYQTDINFKSGLTREEQDKLDDLYYAKKNNFDYDKREITRIRELGQDRLLERINADPYLAEKLERLDLINKELSSFGKTENTSYYYEELEKQEQNFADSLDITYNELLEGKNPSGVSYYSMFKESSWYQNNHIIKERVIEDEDTGEIRKRRSEQPTNQWRRHTPTPEYIEMKPANHFYKVVDKEFYTNDKGEKIILKNSDNLDVLRRFKPKTNEEYRKEFGVDHPFLNQEFVDLRKSYKNGTASAKDKVDYENLIFIQDRMMKSQENIPYNQRLGLAVPFKEKHTFERTIESGGKNIKDKGASIVDGIKRAFTRTDQDIDQNGVPTGDESTSNDISRLATMDNNQVRHIPVRFSKKGEAENASYDVWGGVLEYVGAINRKSELDKDLAFINGLEQILGDPANQPKSQDKNMILNNIYKRYIPELSANINKGGNLRLDTLKSFVNSVMYNEEYFKGYDMFGVNTQKALNTVMGLSSYAMMGLSPISWTVNWLSGNIQNIIESVGGRDYNFKDFTAAHADIYTGGKYGSAIKDMQSDFVKGKVGNLSFWGQIMEIWDPLQGDFENEYGQKTSWNTAKNIFHTGIFAGKIWGEWEIQMKTFIAFMKANKLYNGKVYSKEDFITSKIGTQLEDKTLEQISKLKLEAIKEWDKLDVNLLDMMEMSKEGKVKIKDQYKDDFQFGSEDFSNIVAKLHAMQKKLNGSYNKFDKAWAEKTSLGKAMFYFRKYFIPIAMNRWGTRRANYESMTVEQGFYLTFLQTVGKDIAKFKFTIVKNWHTYSDFEKRAIKKTLADALMVLAIMTLYSVFLGFNPDDPDRFRKLREKNWAAQSAVFVLLRVRSETEQFMPFSGIEEIKGIYNNPSLALGQMSTYMSMSRLTIEHLLDVIPGVDFNSSLYYQRKSSEATLLGMTLRDEGDSKLFSQLMQTFAGYSGKTFHPDEAIKSWEYAQKQRQR